MAVSATNRLRYRAILIAREVKALFCATPERWRERPPSWLTLLRALRSPKAFLWRAVFLGQDGKPHRAGEVMLADLRDFALVGRSVFDPDPLVMARRVGRQETAMRIINYLNLDEATVQKIMELDDGLE